MHVLGLAVDSVAVVTGHQEGTGNATRLTSLTSAARRMLGTGAAAGTSEGPTAADDQYDGHPFGGGAAAGSSGNADDGDSVMTCLALLAALPAASWPN